MPDTTNDDSVDAGAEATDATDDLPADDPTTVDVSAEISNGRVNGTARP